MGKPHAFLMSALDGGEWSESNLGCFTRKARVPSTQWIGDWVDPGADLDTVMKGKRSWTIFI
jgi:hypothetical protein